MENGELQITVFYFPCLKINIQCLMLKLNNVKLKLF